MIVLAALLVALVSILSILLVALGARGVLKRNSLAGIRTAATRRSDAAWRNAHRAALVPTTVGCVGSLCFAVATIATAQNLNISGLLLALSILALMAGIVLALVRAQVAASGTEPSDSDGQRSPV